jgi:hypothetical protein
MAVDDLRRGSMMAHLLDALERGEDIGHYGWLTFCDDRGSLPRSRRGRRLVEQGPRPR